MGGSPSLKFLCSQGPDFCVCGEGGSWGAARTGGVGRRDHESWESSSLPHQGQRLKGC